MKRDSFGICLTKAMLFKNLQSTFTHVRAYEKDATSPLDLKVLLAFPPNVRKRFASNNARFGVT